MTDVSWGWRVGVCYLLLIFYDVRLDLSAGPTTHQLQPSTGYGFTALRLRQHRAQRGPWRRRRQRVGAQRRRARAAGERAECGERRSVGLGR